MKHQRPDKFRINDYIEVSNRYFFELKVLKNLEEQKKQSFLIVNLDLDQAIEKQHKIIRKMIKELNSFYIKMGVKHEAA